MAGILFTNTLSRRRALQVGAATAITALTGAVPAAGQEASDEFTFVVAGLDYREGFNTYNSDVLMVARVIPGSGTVRTVSIPRDLYVEIPGYGVDKITRAFDHGYFGSGETWEGGARMLSDTITTNFGLVIDGMVTATFEGFMTIVAALDGVEVDNPYTVTDPKMRDPETGELGRTWPAGAQTLDGESALMFVRTRNMDGDAGRVMRQHLVLAAILAELQQPEVVTQLPELLEATRDAVETNIPMEVQARLVAMLPEIDPARVTFASIDELLVGGVIDNGMWVYQADWSSLPGIVQGILAGS